MINKPQGTSRYTVCPGDTCWQIARRHQTTVQDIAYCNPGVDLNNLRVGQVICLRPRSKNYTGFTSRRMPTMCISQAEFALSQKMRLLWIQHVLWTRLTIISMVFNLPDKDLVTRRLLRNPRDFEMVLRPLYGNQIAAQFAQLFEEHLVIAAQLVQAAIDGNERSLAANNRDWYNNAAEIAEFLSRINPYWRRSDWLAMLNEHLDLTKDEAVQIISGQYGQGISTYNRIERQALEMADVMTNGIVQQFPNNYQR